ncbi:uncharacterized protein LOC126575107 isoform X1 [Anopheles aquasalis]|uniref:Putative plasma membrane protein n=1 Tax=Anopheles aquasalis TaxID=42839 RepID=T1DQX3_ANOAQ|nr:uncharacterized protein LOC126575107 isoform X1 [Anopheles aquasalis]
MSSVMGTSTKAQRKQPKMLLRSTSFQKLCSIPYNFKLEVVRTYQEHIKTVIRFLKIVTRAYMVSICLRLLSTIITVTKVVKIRNLLMKRRPAPITHESKPTQMNPSPAVRAKSFSRFPGSRVATSGLLELYLATAQLILTYSCILYIGFQISFLFYILWWSSSVPSGLIFLVLGLSYMGFILGKIALNGKFCLA